MRMEQSLLIEPATLQKLKCKKCANYLSIFPIYLQEDKAVCGRCPLENTDNIVRDDAFENIARYIIFPCIHQKFGCKEQLLPDKLTDHENLCSFRKFDCPSKFYSKCEWQGQSADLVEHFQDTHPELLLKEPHFPVDFLNNQRDNLLLSHSDELFIVKKDIDSRTHTLSCSVLYIGCTEKSKNYYYRLRLESANKNYTHRLPQRPISLSSNENTSKITGDTIKEKLYDPAYVTVYIDISENLENPTSDEVKAAFKDPKINYELLSELECPICFDYIVPPIFQCVEGHSICNNCKVKITECSICKQPMQNTRNIVLEKMTALLYYPCKFHKMGCTYSAKSNEIIVHERACEYGPYECPLKESLNCEWKAQVSEVVNHVEGEHEDSILEHDKVNVPFNSSTTIADSYLIKFADRIFKLNFTYENNMFYWSLHLIGPSELCQKYTFDIDIVNNSKKNMRIYLKGACLPLEAREETIRKNCCMIMTLQQLTPFINNGILSFKVHVLKEE